MCIMLCSVHGQISCFPQEPSTTEDTPWIHWLTNVKLIVANSIRVHSFSLPDWSLTQNALGMGTSNSAGVQEEPRRLSKTEM